MKWNEKTHNISMWKMWAIGKELRAFDVCLETEKTKKNESKKSTNIARCNPLNSRRKHKKVSKSRSTASVVYGVFFSERIRFIIKYFRKITAEVRENNFFRKKIYALWTNWKLDFFLMEYFANLVSLLSLDKRQDVKLFFFLTFDFELG